MSKQYVAFRTFVLVEHKTGVSALFHKGVPRPLRPSLVDLAISQGVVEYTAGIAADLDAKAAPVNTELKEAIREAIDSLIDSGTGDDFGTDGKPKVRSLERVMGQNISAADRDSVWDAEFSS